jgi:2-(1,2-epoxy-1,2-dihydrophenyl)acetyl-CoA isomerase
MSLVLCERRGSVATLTLNRPARHNSLVPALLGELREALEKLSPDAEVRAVILKASGRSFSTGGDLKGFADHEGDLGGYANALVGELNRVMLAMLRLPMPIVCAVHGTVTGGAVGLVLASDLVLLSPQASFTPYYGAVGFSPDGGWTALLPRVVGRARAAAALLANRTITAEEAVHWGLANERVASERLGARARELAEAIARQRPESVRQSKRLLNAEIDAIAERLEAERKTFVATVMSEAAREGVKAFLERKARA